MCLEFQSVTSVSSEKVKKEQVEWNVEINREQSETELEARGKMRERFWNKNDVDKSDSQTREEERVVTCDRGGDVMKGAEGEKE